MKQTSAPNIFQMGQNPQKPKEPSLVEVRTPLMLAQQGRMAEAEQAALKLTQQYPQHGGGWKVLGVIMRFAGRLNDALAPMQTACKLSPNDPEAFNNLGSTLQAMNDIRHAEACYKHAIALQPDYITALDNLATMLLGASRQSDALPLLERKLALHPDDAYTRHIVHFLRGEQSERAPAQYVERTFNEYADKFEQHLLTGLNYQVPTQLATLIEQSGRAPQGAWRVMDLGCGTGLMGAAIAGRVGNLIGVDLAPAMLDKAREKNLYHSLLCADVLPTMQAEAPASFDLITAADVFIYIGKLDDIVAQAKRLLRNGGLLAFSVENIERAADAQGPEPDFQLKPSGRYGQSAAYLDQLARTNGFQPVAQLDTVLRLEATTPIHGRLLVWQS